MQTRVSSFLRQSSDYWRMRPLISVYTKEDKWIRTSVKVDTLLRSDTALKRSIEEYASICVNDRMRFTGISFRGAD